MTADGQPTALGAIFDTNSDGRFDLVIYEDGLLAVKGTHVGVALRGAGAGMGGAGAGIGWLAGGSYEANRLAQRLEGSRDRLVDQETSFFIPHPSITGLTLRKRWHGHSLTVHTSDYVTGRRFDWKPALNSFEQIEDRLRSVFRELVHRE